MKANEFVKKFGYKHNAVNLKYLPLNQHAELERLVESHEIVEYIGNDLDGAKQVYAFTKDCVHIAMHDRMIPVIRLKQAIADVESCQ